MLNFLKNRKNAVADLENRLNELNAEIGRLEQNKISLLEANKNQENELKQLKARSNNLDNEINSRLQAVKNIEAGFGVLEEIGFERYIPTMYDDDIENKIFECESKLAKMLGDDKVIIQTREYRIDSSASKGKKFQVNYGKNLLIGFNTYAQSKEKSLNTNNFYEHWRLIEKKFDIFNKQGNLLGISLNSDYLTILLELLKLKLELKEQKAKDRELLKEEKQRMKEQEKLLEEIAREEKQIEQERKSMDIAFNAALSYEERNEIKAKMNKLDKRLESLNYRRNHSKAGWLYVISSPSLPNMTKIGCTRRVNPTIRVAELSSSSLPYAFLAHGFVFSDDCFELEANIHKYFDDKRIALNREFFYVTPEEAINVLENEFNQKVHSFYSPEILENEEE